MRCICWFLSVPSARSVVRIRADVAEPPLRFAPRGDRVHAARDQLAGPHLEVEGQFLVDFVGDSRAPGDAVEEGFIRVKVRAQGLGIRTREIAAANRVHSAVCAVSCRRPFGVSR